MDCGSSGFHDGDEKSTRTYANVVRGEDSSASMTNSWWRKLQLLPLLPQSIFFVNTELNVGIP